MFAREVKVAVRLNDHFNPSLKAKGYLDRKRRAKPSAPMAAPSNNAVVPPSGTLLIVGGIGWRVALGIVAECEHQGANGRRTEYQFV